MSFYVIYLYKILIKRIFSTTTKMCGHLKLPNSGLRTFYNFSYKWMWKWKCCIKEILHHRATLIYTVEGDCLNWKIFSFYFRKHAKATSCCFDLVSSLYLARKQSSCVDLFTLTNVACNIVYIHYFLNNPDLEIILTLLVA